MRVFSFFMSVSFTCLLTAGAVHGQAPAGNTPADKDVLVGKDGEKLIGQMEHADGTSVVFKSDVAGEVTIEWAKIQELRSAGKFAVIPKGAKLRSKEDEANVPRGTVTATDQQIAVNTGTQPAPAPVPVGNVANVVAQPAFEGAFVRQGFFKGWNGGLTGAIALITSTQKSQTYTGAVNLVRAVPNENWIDLRSRTTIEFNGAYGKISQPLTPTVKTSLSHFALEQDWYLKPRLFVFGEGILDHNFAQGLKLQQDYGAGLGFVVLKSDVQEFDVKVSANYIDQRFEVSGFDKTLFGTVFGETYTRKFAHGILFNEQGGFTPTWNDTSAYSAFVGAGLTFPVYHRFGLTMGALDNYLNDPPPGFRKNSFQFTAGATYSLR
ncbi:MAG: DUF481 domain-containing protein [Acidobacteriaceae bacterium]|nr:DUF481 domain-containing protein [Acidobacteriaceae bacterium]